MYLPIPFTLGKRVQSDSTPVLKTRAPYCHHHRSASADSTEYWTWNGPEDGDNVQEDVEDVVTEETSSYSPPVMDYCNSPRLEQIERFDDAPSFDLELLSNSLDSGSSYEASYSFSSDLPSESFSPLLRQDMVYASSSLSDSPIDGLGLVNLTRNNRPFDGLGLVRIHSGRQRGEEQDQEDEDELSSTFLHDLEAMFLDKDYEVIEAPTIRVEDSPTMEEQLVAPPGSPVTASPARNSLTSKIKHALQPRGPSTPNMNTALPTSISCTTVSASTSTSSTTSVSSTSSFIRRTCSAFRSQYNLNALRAEHALMTESPASTSSSPGKRTRKTEDSKRTGFLQPVDRTSQPVPLTGPTRKVSVSVSMGEGVTPMTPAPITPITPGGKRSLQTHSVRDSKDWKDVRDLSVLGTISSGLKKREKK